MAYLTHYVGGQRKYLRHLTQLPYYLFCCFGGDFCLTQMPSVATAFFFALQNQRDPSSKKVLKSALE